MKKIYITENQRKDIFKPFKRIFINETQEKKLFNESFKVDDVQKTVQWVDDDSISNNTNYKNYEITSNDLILKPWHVFLEQSGLSCYCLYNFKDIYLQKLIKKNIRHDVDWNGNELDIHYNWEKENKDAFLKHSASYAALLLNHLTNKIKTQQREYSDDVTLKYIAYPQSSASFNMDFTTNYLKPYLTQYYPDVEVIDDMFLKNYDSRTIGVNEELAKNIGCDINDLIRIRKIALKCDTNSKIIPIRKQIDDLLNPIIHQLEINDARESYQWNASSEKALKTKKLYKTEEGLYFDADNDDFNEEWVNSTQTKQQEKKAKAQLYQFDFEKHDTTKPLQILWVDDKRNPENFLKQVNNDSEASRRIFNFYNYLKEQGYTFEFKWVKTLKQFSDYIKQNGLPDLISFDYDLDEVPKDSKQWKEIEKYGGKKSTDLVQWLIRYCKKNKLSLPDYYIHSANIKQNGRLNLYKELTSFVNQNVQEQTNKQNISIIENICENDTDTQTVTLTNNGDSSRKKNKKIDKTVLVTTQKLYQLMLRLKETYATCQEAYDIFAKDIERYKSLEGLAKYSNTKKESEKTIDKYTNDSKEHWEIKSWPNFARRVLTNLFITNEDVLKAIHEKDKKTKIIVIFDDNVAGGSSLDKTCYALEQAKWNYIIPLSLSLMPVGGQAQYERPKNKARSEWLKKHEKETEDDFFNNTRYQMSLNVSDPNKENQEIRNRRDITYSPLNKNARPLQTYKPETSKVPIGGDYKQATRKQNNKSKQLKKMFRLKLTNGNTFEADGTDFEKLRKEIQAKFPNMKEKVITKLIKNPQNFYMG